MASPELTEPRATTAEVPVRSEQGQKIVHDYFDEREKFLFAEHLVKGSVTDGILQKDEELREHIGDNLSRNLQEYLLANLSSDEIADFIKTTVFEAADAARDDAVEQQTRKIQQLEYDARAAREVADRKISELIQQNGHLVQASRIATVGMLQAFSHDEAAQAIIQEHMSEIENEVYTPPAPEAPVSSDVHASEAETEELNLDSSRKKLGIAAVRWISEKIKVITGEVSIKKSA